MIEVKSAAPIPLIEKPTRNYYVGQLVMLNWFRLQISLLWDFDGLQEILDRGYEWIWDKLMELEGNQSATESE